MILRPKWGFAAKFFCGLAIYGILNWLSLNGFPPTGEPLVAICRNLIGIKKSYPVV